MRALASEALEPGQEARPDGPTALPSTSSWGLRLAFATATVSGVAVFVNGHGVKAFGAASSVYTTAKNLVAAVLLLGLAALAGRLRSGERLTRPSAPAQWAGLAAIAVVGGSVPFLLFFEGLSRASSTQAAFIQKSLVVWVALLAIPILKERLGLWHLAAIGLLLAGLASLQGGVAQIRFGGGESLILAATLMWAVEIIVAKPLLRSLTPLTIGVARMGGGAAVLIGYLAATGRFGALVGLSANQWGWAALTGAILATYVATWYAALARAQAVDVTAVLVFGAVVTAFLQAGANGTALGPQALGLTLVTVGAVSVVAGAAVRRARAVVLR